MSTQTTTLKSFGQSFWHVLSRAGFFAPLLALYIIGLPILSLSRALLSLWQYQHYDHIAYLSVFVYGLRADLVMLSLLTVIPLMLSPLFVLLRAWQPWQRFTYYWLIAAVVFLIFMEAITPGFMAEYSTRPNRLLIEYLKYPHEVLPMLWKGFKLELLISFMALLAAFTIMRSGARAWLLQRNLLKQRHYWLLLPMLFVLCVFSIRSTLGHRPVNPAFFAITDDALVNDLIINSSYSTLYAAYNLKHESHTSEIYGDMSTEEMFKTFESTRELLHDKRTLLHNKTLPTLIHQVPSRHRERPLNIVIILEESLGATFVESLGGTPVTPELEKLKQEGWWFENLYATGTRSVRGIEAVVAGFPPTPAESVVKLSLSQDHFTTLASLLAAKGYDTRFIYGGESHFDNMRSFFMGNGFQHVTEEKDFVHPTFVGSWGVSDEDLFNRAHQEIAQQHATGKPFFSLIFSSSNHAPFEFPDGRIKPFEQPKATDNNAVKYADYALGQFFEKAKASDYYQDTLFLIVADHDIRVRGDSLIPIKNFHIPGLILGADLEPKTIQTVASQIDLPTTLLSLAGLDITTPMIGRDISAEDAQLPGRAIMQYYDNYGWMEGNALVVLRPEQPPTFAHFDAQQKTLALSKPPMHAKAILHRALGNALLPTWLYQTQRYQTDLSLQSLQPFK